MSRGILKRSNSLPDSLDLVMENTLFKSYPARNRSYSLSDIEKISLEECSWSINKEGTAETDTVKKTYPLPQE